MQIIKPLIFFLSLIIVGCSGIPVDQDGSVNIEQPLKVQFAGFAYLGDEKSIAKNYMRSVVANSVDKDGVSLVDKALIARLRNVVPKHIALGYDLADYNEQSSVALALVMDREMVNVERIADSYKAIVELGFQILVFDFDSMSVMGAYPVTLQYIDVAKRAPSSSDIQAIIRGALTGEFAGLDYTKNIISEFAALLSDIEISQSNSSYLQVTSVKIEDKAQEQLPNYLQDLANAKNFIANNFAKFLGQNQKVSMLPFTSGYAIGNKMAARFSNGDVFNLTIPDTDYGVDVVLRGFKKIPHQENNYSESYIYGAYFDLKVFEPLGGRIYLDSQFVRADTEIFPKDSARDDEWPIYEDRVLTFFNSLTKELDSPGRQWVALHRGDARVVKELKQFKKIVESCK